MARGKAANVGDTNVSQNGYHYTRTEKGWELTHKLIMEKTLGRPLAENEMVRFKDKDRTNLDPDNLYVIVKREQKQKRIAQIEARIEELQAELAILRDEV